ncbi:MAG: outer membrane beta-barrel protein, partial [Oceanicaulis sp.]
ALFARAILPVNDRIDLFARVGYGHFSVEGEVKGEIDGATESVSLDDDAGGVAFGAGAEFVVTGANAVRIDYTRYELDDLDDLNVDRASVTYIRRF